MNSKLKGTLNMRRTGIAFAVFIFCIFALSKTPAQGPTRTVEVHAQRYAFEPSSISVRHGETIRLRVISDDVPHSLLIRQLGINVVSTKSNPGETVFTANQTGDFEGRCGRFCGSGHGQMVFTLKVTAD
jgi:cytochrome c oxidase subunit 2